MTQESVDAFVDEITNRLEYFRQEFDLTYAESVGALEILKQALILEAFEVDDIDEEEN